MSGATALHLAADGGHGPVVRLLLAHGADMNAVIRPQRLLHMLTAYGVGSTPLHLAAELGHLEAVLAILQVRTACTACGTATRACISQAAARRAVLHAA